MSTFQSFLVGLSTSGLLHNAFIAPLLLVLGDFLTGLGSALKNKNFDFSKIADVMGKDSDLLKYGVGALTLFTANSLHILTPELNSFFGGVGSIAISVVILHSILLNLIELLPAAWQPEAKVIAAQVEQEVQTVLNQGSVSPPPSSAAVVPFGAAHPSLLAPDPPPLAGQVPYDQMATMAFPAIASVQAQPQYKMPSGVISSSPGSV